MATHRELRQVIKATMASIENIGKVHTYERFLTSKRELRALYTIDKNGADQVRGWFIRRSDAQTENVCADDTESVNGWVIRGFMALDDSEESELVFDDLIDGIIDAFAALDELIPGTELLAGDDSIVIRLEDSMPVMFAGVLCHSASLVLRTRTIY